MVIVNCFVMVNCVVVVSFVYHVNVPLSCPPRQKQIEKGYRRYWAKAYGADVNWPYKTLQKSKENPRILHY